VDSRIQQHLLVQKQEESIIKARGKSTEVTNSDAQSRCGLVMLEFEAKIHCLPTHSYVSECYFCLGGERCGLFHNFWSINLQSRQSLMRGHLPSAVNLFIVFSVVIMSFQRKTCCWKWVQVFLSLAFMLKQSLSLANFTSRQPLFAEKFGYADF
jgi:hypothetical protein